MITNLQGQGDDDVRTVRLNVEGRRRGESRRRGEGGRYVLVAVRERAGADSVPEAVLRPLLNEGQHGSLMGYLELSFTSRRAQVARAGVRLSGVALGSRQATAGADADTWIA